MWVGQHYITLHYITLGYLTLHYIAVHYITLHYITLHLYSACSRRFTGARPSQYSDSDKFIRFSTEVDGTNI